MKIITALLIPFYFLFIHAEEHDIANEIDEEIKSLEKAKIELEAEASDLQVQANQLYREAAIIEERLREANHQNKKILTREDLSELLKGRIGSCDIYSGTEENEYKIVNNRGEAIRFYFADEKHSQAPYMEINNQEKTFVIKQPVFKPELSKASGMEATISYKVNDSNEVEYLSVYFLGQKIEDRFLGFSSLKPYRIICKTNLVD